MAVLDKGLKHAPKSNLNKFNTYIGIQKYIRKINIKKYMMNNLWKPGNSRIEITQPEVHSTLRNASLFNPQITNNQNVEVFKNLVLQDIDQIKIKKAADPIHIRNGIKRLTERKDIVIRPADKGGAIVLQSKEQYLTELNRQLQDGTTYTKLLGNPTSKYKKQLEVIVELGKKKNILNAKESKYLIPETCRIPIIYTIPKIHKNKENPPGRPIVNSIDSLTSRMGKYIDYFIQPAVQQTQAYLKDTKHTLQFLNEVPVLEGRTLLATADVTSLYTIVQHYDAISATKWLLRKYSTLICKQRKYLLKCLDFCLKCNYFWHNQTYFKQSVGIAMGAKFAPGVANAFMAQWEETAVYTNTPAELTLYKRFIDDVVIVWNGDKESLEAFLNKLNDNTKNINLVWRIEEKEIDFLDLNISLEGQKIVTKTHFKKVDANSYLSTDSCHFKPWLYNIPKGQFTRLKRNCTKEEDYRNQAQVIGERFKAKGYNEDWLKNQIEHVNLLDRNKMLEEQPKTRVQNEVPSIVLDFNTQHRDVAKVIQKHWHILKNDKDLREILPERPNIVYKRAPTIRDLIVKSVLDPPPTSTYTFFSGKGFYPCRNCYACRHARKFQGKRKDFTATNTGQNFIIRDFIGCHTEGVVYVLQCSCNLQYVGRTKRALKTRIKEHVQNIKSGFLKHNVSKHFALVHNRDPTHLQFWGIEKHKPMWRGSHLVRDISRKESRWIHTLRTLVPGGLNVEFDLNCFLNDF